MEQYIQKSAVAAEAKDLYEDIDKCIGDLVLARSKHDQRGISDAHWKMETLMVNTQQVLSYILDTLEVKEINSTNVFIEKACRFIKERLSFDDSWHVEGEDCMLDKVIEDFKKYMEE